MSSDHRTNRDRCIKCDGFLPPEGGTESAHAREDGSYCYECVSPPRIALVGCGSAKVDLEQDETTEARDLYSSNYFGLKREYAETCCDQWMILSAEHGLLSPYEEIATYDASLKPSSDSYIGDYEAGKWSVQTSQSLETFKSFQSIHARFIVLAGEDYVKHLESTLGSWSNVEYPFRSDDLGGIGDQMGWLRDEVDTHQPPGQANLENFAIATDGGTKKGDNSDR